VIALLRGQGDPGESSLLDRDLKRSPATKRHYMLNSRRHLGVQLISPDPSVRRRTEAERQAFVFLD
jgi:hypothetical protein